MQSENHLRLLRYILIALCLAGSLVAGYLTFSAFTETSFLCGEGGGCDIVRQSQYSKVMGIPVALIGLLGYLGLFAVLVMEQRSEFFEDNGPMLVFGLSLIGFLYSAYLTYLELNVIHAVCPYCVASAVIMTVVSGLALYRTIHIILA